MLSQLFRNSVPFLLQEIWIQYNEMQEKGEYMAFVESGTSLLALVLHSDLYMDIMQSTCKKMQWAKEKC